MFDRRQERRICRVQIISKVMVANGRLARKGGHEVRDAIGTICHARSEASGWHRQNATSQRPRARLRLEKSQPGMVLSEHALEFRLAQNHARG